MDKFTFDVNNYNWTIEEVSLDVIQKVMLNENNYLGCCVMDKNNRIYILEGNYDNKLKTIEHEVTHAVLFSNNIIDIKDCDKETLAEIFEKYARVIINIVDNYSVYKLKED